MGEYRKRVEKNSKMPQNSKCVDCGASYPKWASVRYGTFFCLECAALHRSLGVYLDFVKSIGLDSWDKESYLPIEYGGNDKFLEYLRQNGLDSLETEKRYKNEKVIEYTKVLMKKIFDETGVQCMPSEKKETISRPKNRRYERSVELKSQGSAKEKDDVKSSSTSLYSTSKFSNSISSLKTIIGDNVKIIAEKTAEYGSKIGSSVKSHAKSILEKGSETVLSMKKDNPKSDERDSKVHSSTKKMQKNSAKNHDWS